MDTALTWFIRIWIGIVIFLNVIAITGFFLTAPDFASGWQRTAATYSPFNVWNFLMEIITLSPAIGAYFWREKRRERSKKLHFN